MTIHHYQGDLPKKLRLGKSLAIDCETMGLNLSRDRLCLIQLSSGDGHAHLVQFNKDFAAPNLKKLLGDASVEKLFHFARFDLAAIEAYLGLRCSNIYCTRTASKLVRTFTDRHGLKDLCRDLIGVEISKQQQSSDWGAQDLSEEQLNYAASDVLYLHQLKEKLDVMLAREGRSDLARALFEVLPARAALDLIGYGEVDIFAH